MNVLDFKKKKLAQQKISMITCYDYTSAKILAESTVDCLLVGDSVAMVMHGFKDTTAATLTMMCLHTAAVAKGSGNKFVIADLPFLSYRKSMTQSVLAVHKLMLAGAHAVKLEGAAGNLKLVRHLTESGVPVVGHLGMTPQFVNLLGGFKVQGKSEKSASQIIDSALELEEAGCCAIVIECTPTSLAKVITQKLEIPTIGIGAGRDTDGQVLVFQDLLGLQNELQPRFVKRFVNGFEYLQNGIEDFINQIKQGEFPQHEHCY